MFTTALLAHASALAGGYVWLDHAHIEDGLALAAPGAWTSLFQKGFAGTGFYRPLMALSLSIDAAIGGTPALFRAVTLGWHAAAATFTWLAARRFGCSRPSALLAGALFGVHPVTGIVADLIAFRSEAMITVFLLGLVLAHLARRPALAAMALLLGALTKETALVLAPLVIGMLELGRAEWDGGARRVRLPLLSAELASLLTALALRAAYAPSFRARHPELDLSSQLGTRLGAFFRSTLSLVLPVDGSICDATPIHELASLPALFGALALALSVSMAFQRGVVGKLFLLALLPGLNLVPIMRLWSPHYCYLPLAFGVILAARALDAAPRLMPGVALATFILAVTTVYRGTRFTSDESLWSAEVTRRPECLEGQFFLGEVARESGELARAARHYRAALTPSAGILAYVDRASALQNLGAVSFQQGRLEEAADAWTLALEANRDPERRRELSINLAALELRAGHAPATLKRLEGEIDRLDALPEALFLYARALHALGREEDALATLRRLRDPAGVNPRN